MTDRLKRLEQRRGQLLASLAELQAMTQGEQVQKEVYELQGLLATLDALIGRCRRATREPLRREAQAPLPGVELARITRTPRAELRVCVRKFKDRRSIDVRLWFKPKGSDEWTASRKGVAFEEAQLDAFMDALRLARQHLGG